MEPEESKTTKPPGTKPSFGIEQHNKMIQTLDSVITDIKKYNQDNLELNNGIKDILNAIGRINAFYMSINQPINKE